ncbi:hypothetical protein TYRP_005299 [Tyrophagus putrescentiae]|nr:hypothetical protein TYRP_005299 [Tyrophagus putrescentiae]
MHFFVFVILLTLNYGSFFIEAKSYHTPFFFDSRQEYDYENALKTDNDYLEPESVFPQMATTIFEAPAKTDFDARNSFKLEDTPNIISLLKRKKKPLPENKIESNLKLLILPPMEYGLPSLNSEDAVVKLPVNDKISVVPTIIKTDDDQLFTDWKKKLARIIQFKQGNRGFFSVSEKDTSEEEPKLKGTLSIPPRFGKR